MYQTLSASLVFILHIIAEAGAISFTHEGTILKATDLINLILEFVLLTFYYFQIMSY